MSSFETCVMTEAGVALFAQADSANKIVFTKAVSAGTVLSDPTDINSYDGIEGTIASSAATDKVVRVTTEFGTSSNPNGEYIKTVAVLGRLASETGDGELVAFMSDNRGMYVPPTTGLPVNTHIIFNIDTSLVPDTAAVNITSANAVPLGDFLRLKERTLTTHADGDPLEGETQRVFGEKTFADKLTADGAFYVIEDTHLEADATFSITKTTGKADFLGKTTFSSDVNFLQLSNDEFRKMNVAMFANFKNQAAFDGETIFDDNVYINNAGDEERLQCWAKSFFNKQIHVRGSNILVDDGNFPSKTNITHDGITITADESWSPDTTYLSDRFNVVEGEDSNSLYTLSFCEGKLDLLRKGDGWSTKVAQTADQIEITDTRTATHSKFSKYGFYVYNGTKTNSVTKDGLAVGTQFGLSDAGLCRAKNLIINNSYGITSSGRISGVVPYYEYAEEPPESLNVTEVPIGAIVGIFFGDNDEYHTGETIVDPQLGQYKGDGQGDISFYHARGTFRVIIGKINTGYAQIGLGIRIA